MIKHARIGKAALLLLRRSAAFNPHSKSQAGCGRLLDDQHARIAKAVLLLLKALLSIPKRCDPPVALA